MSADVILVIVAFIGSCALAGLSFFLGFNKNRTIDDPNLAAGWIRAHAPEDEVARVIVAQDKQTALVRTVSGQFYYALSMGDRHVVKPLSADYIARDSHNTLRITLPDITTPKRYFYSDAAALSSFFEIGKEGTT